MNLELVMLRTVQSQCIHCFKDTKLRKKSHSTSGWQNRQCQETIPVAALLESYVRAQSECKQETFVKSEIRLNCMFLVGKTKQKKTPKRKPMRSSKCFQYFITLTLYVKHVKLFIVFLRSFFFLPLLHKVTLKSGLKIDIFFFL